MKDYHLTVLVIGFGLAYGILYLVRRDHLYIRQGVFWIGIALLSLALAIWHGWRGSAQTRLVEAVAAHTASARAGTR